MRKINIRIPVLLTALFLVATAAVAQSVTTTSTITTYAGLNRSDYGDGGPVASAQLFRNNGIAFDSSGNLYVADTGHSLIRKITPQGGISTFSSALTTPVGIAVDSSDNVYVSDNFAHVVKKITPAGVASNFAGTGETGSSGDGGPATSATLFGPFNLAFDASGNLYIADTQNRKIRKVTPAGVISTFAGTGQPANGQNLGNGSAATAAALSNPGGMVFDSAGNMYFADLGNASVRKITPAGTISAFAGTTFSPGATGDGAAATSAKLQNPASVAYDGSDIYICDQGNSRVRKVSGGTISAAVGTGTMPSGGDGGPATSAQLARCSGLVFRSGSLYISDFGNNNIRVVSGGTISTLIWGYGGDGGAATSAVIQTPTGLAVDSSGNLYVGEEESHRVRRITPAGIISTFAGNGLAGFGGDGSAATAAPLGEVGGLAFDLNGNLLIADQGAHVIRKVTPGGIITTIAGTGNSGGFAGDGGPATSAQLNSPLMPRVDGAGNIYISDVDNKRVRKVTPAGTISTVAGNGGSGSTGDGGLATAAEVTPFGLALDSAGNLYIADPINNNIRKVTTAGIISTVLGAGASGTQTLNQPITLTFDSSGNMFVNEYGALKILKRTPTGTVTTVAGSGVRGTSGDGGAATSARFDYPADMILNAGGDFFISDRLAHSVRKVTFVQQGNVTISDRGGTSVTSAGSGSTVVAGYGSIAPTGGSTTPSGLAIFGYRQNGVLVSEAGVPASTVLQYGRIYAEVGGSVNTGLAIANPNSSEATISFYFTDANGQNFGAGTTTIPAYQQIAKFLDQSPFNGGSAVSGSFTFQSNISVAVIALRGLTNQRGEFLLTTLPVADLGGSSSTSAFLFPHFAEGGGWISQIILVNGGDSTLTGTVVFRNAQGAANPVTIGGTTSDSFSYTIPARSSVKLQTAGTASSTLSGFVRVTPTGGTAAPTGLGIFSYRVNGITVAEAGVPAASAGSAFRFYAETLGTFGNAGSIQTGLAIANNSGTAAIVTVDLTRFDGTSLGLTGTLTVPASGQTPVFLNQITGLSAVPSTFQGIMRVSSSSSISVVGLRGRYNERGDFLITTTPVVDEAASTTTQPRFFPQVADSGGYTTQFIVFSGQSGQAASANLDLRSASGGAMNLTTQ